MGINLEYDGACINDVPEHKQFEKSRIEMKTLKHDERGYFCLVFFTYTSKLHSFLNEQPIYFHHIQEHNAIAIFLGDLLEKLEPAELKILEVNCNIHRAIYNNKFSWHIYHRTIILDLFTNLVHPLQRPSCTRNSPSLVNKIETPIYHFQITIGVCMTNAWKVGGHRAHFGNLIV